MFIEVGFCGNRPHPPTFGGKMEGDFVEGTTWNVEMVWGDELEPTNAQI